MIRIKNYYINMKLLTYLLLFMLISVLVINSSMLYLPKYLGNLAIKQLYWYLIGFLIIFIYLFVSDGNYKYSFYFYLFNIILLSVLLLIGTPINGSKCWLIVPCIGSIQPSEFMKIALIISLSKVISKYKGKNYKDEIVLLLKVIIISFFPILLTFLEPDTGAVFIYFIIIGSILFISPLRKRWFVFILVLILIFVGIFLYLYFFKQELFITIFGSNLFYRINRLLDWKNGKGFQLENSLVSIGSSGILGHGYRRTPIYFPESGTDFIFAVYASNFGLVGSILLFILFLFFDKCLIDISKKTNNITNKYIIIGTLGMLIYQQVQNIGMTLGILPITGITLPFISYGGSSLLSYFLIMAIIFKISSDNKRLINKKK